MKKQLILVVDDVPENIDVLVGILAPHYQVRAATCGRQALQIAEAAEPPDLILLDIMMPGMDGYDVCQALKAQERTRDIPVIFITAISEIEAVVRGFEIGGVDYIVKPFNAVELISRVGTHLSLRNATELLKGQNAVLERTVEEKTAALRRKNGQLRAALEQKEELLDKLNRLYARFQGLQEEERKKMAADVHDSLGQLLTAIKMGLFRIQSQSASADEKLRHKIEETLGLADEAIRAAQTVSAGFRPDILDNLGLIEAISWYCRTMRESSGVAFELSVEGTPPPLEKRVELQLYRVLQEACTNIIRHARASACRVTVTGNDGEVRVVIKDDGVGIGSDRIGDVESLGIYGMRKRMEDIRGGFSIEGTPGRGTAVTLTAPAGGDARD